MTHVHHALPGVPHAVSGYVPAYATAVAQGEFAPQGIGGAVIGTAAPVLGELLGRLGGLLPFAAQPQAAFAPQGVFGDILKSVAPTVGTVAGQLGGLLPFSAQPQAA
ncbi:hypothetical protein AAB983_31460, partial [Burkholderia contaminans]